MSATTETRRLRAPRGFGALRRMFRRDVMISLALFVLVIAAWEVAVPLLNVPSYILPQPSAVLSALIRGLSAPPLAREGYWLHAGVTLVEALGGFAIGSVLGTLLGAVIGQSRTVETIFKPYIVALQSLPRIALAPLLVLWLGFGLNSKLAIAALATFFPLVINTMVGINSVDEERRDLLKGLGANRWQTFRMVAFPTALPYIFAGLDMAIVYSVVGALVGEFVGAERGLGVLILQASVSLDTAGQFSVFIILSLMGVALSTVLNVVRRRVLFWAPSERNRVVGT